MDNEKTPQSIAVTPSPAKSVITPYAMAKMSEDLYLSSKSYTPEDHFPLINYYLCSASIELALKSAILSVDCTQNQKDTLKKIRHNLKELIKEFEKTIQPDLLQENEKQVLHQINKYFATKGLEYFTTEMIEAAVRGYKDLPDIKKLEKISEKVNTYLVRNEYFFDAKTSDTATRGIFTLY